MTIKRYVGVQLFFSFDCCILFSFVYLIGLLKGAVNQLMWLAELKPGAHGRATNQRGEGTRWVRTDVVGKHGGKDGGPSRTSASGAGA
jgi:hypothetical protein